MSVRFFILFPDKDLEAALCLQALTSIKSSLTDVWIGALIPPSNNWIQEGQSPVDDWIPFTSKTSELKAKILDFLPDYLLDLSGQSRYSRLRRKASILDFVLSYKVYRTIAAKQLFQDKAAELTSEIKSLLSVFDLTDKRSIPWMIQNSLAIQQDKLPDLFLSAYVVLLLANEPKQTLLSSRFYIDYLSILEVPCVVMGREEDRSIADEIGSQVGCVVFNACGHLTEAENQGVLAGAKMLLGYGPYGHAMAFLHACEIIDLAAYHQNPSALNGPDQVKKRIDNIVK